MVASFTIITSLLITFTHCHTHKQIIEDDGTVYIVKSPSVIFHSISMTLIVFIGLPFGYYHIIKKNYFQHKLSQIVNLTLIECIGGYASINFSDHNSFHSKLGLSILIIFIPIQIIIPLFKHLPFLGSSHSMKNKPFYHNFHRYFGIFLLVIAFPSQWMFGIQHIITSQYAGNNKHWNIFFGHYGPGYFFIFWGIIIIWHRYRSIDAIQMIETFAMSIPSLIELIGELTTTNIDKINANVHVWDHLILDFAFVFCGIFSLIYRILNLSNRMLLHRLTVGMPLWIFGYIMLQHQHGTNDLTISLHKLSGYLTISTGVLRTYSDKYLSIYGALLLTTGIIFNFSNPSICRYWEEKLFYPGMIYQILALFFGFHVAIINVIISQVYIDQIKASELIDEKSQTNGHESNGFSPKKRVAMTECDIESNGKCSTMEMTPLL